MYLFFDTETSGLPRFANAPIWCVWNWPRVVQVAWVLTDGEGNELGSGCHIVKPGRFQFKPEAIGRHGISKQQALREGEPLSEVLDAFVADLSHASTIVAHNVDFDRKVMQGELLRRGRFNAFRGRAAICTMRGATDVCQLPRKRHKYKAGYKWPTLSELHRHLFGTDFAPRHHALADCRACLRCFWELRRRGIQLSAA